MDIPDLHELFTPASEAFRSDPIAAEAASIISAAALHLDAILTPPPVSLYRMVGGVSGLPSIIQASVTSHFSQYFKSAALRVCLESNVTEILREAGPQVSLPDSMRVCLQVLTFM